MEGNPWESVAAEYTNSELDAELGLAKSCNAEPVDEIPWVMVLGIGVPVLLVIAGCCVHCCCRKKGDESYSDDFEPQQLQAKPEKNKKKDKKETKEPKAKRSTKAVKPVEMEAVVAP